METTVLPSNPVDETDSCIQAIHEIKSWIENNTILKGKNFIWRIGIGHYNDMKYIATDVRGNYQYKHYKQWRLDSFDVAFSTLKSFKKYSFVFKSQLNNYLSKGDYIFIYKTPCDSKTRQLFYKTLNS